MSNYEEQSTNFMTNPFNPHKTFIKQKLIQQPIQQEEENSKTIGFQHLSTENNEYTIKPGKMPKKIKIPLQSDKQALGKQSQYNKKVNLRNIIQQPDSDTKTKSKRKTLNIKNQTQPQKLEEKNDTNSTQNKQKQTKSTQTSKHPFQNTLLNPDQLIQTPNDRNLRQKYGHLLPAIHQKKISSEHLHLLKIMSFMDQTIQYLVSSRSMKFVFFQDLKKQIRDNLRILIDLMHIQQLLYLDPELYLIRWERRPDTRAHDILLKLPEIKSKQMRKNKVREVITQFLSVKHQEFLEEKKIKNFDNRNWHPDFNPGKYQIPKRSLPPHPQTINAEVRCIPDKKIQSLPNPKIQQMYKRQKINAQVKPFDQKQAMQMIFRGCSHEEIQEKIYEGVREREKAKKLKEEEEERRIQKQKTTVQQKTLLDMSDKIVQIYIGNNGSRNLFRSRLMIALTERLNQRYSQNAFNCHFNYLLSLKDIAFLTEIFTRDGISVIKCNVSKYKEILQHAKFIAQQPNSQITVNVL